MSKTSNDSKEQKKGAILKFIVTMAKFSSSYDWYCKKRERKIFDESGFLAAFRARQITFFSWTTYRLIRVTF